MTIEIRFLDEATEELDGAAARRAPIARFPYYLAYMITNEVLFVLAVAHEHRRPGY